MPRELYDKGSPRGVIDLAEKLRCANWSIASKDLCAEEADLVLNEMITLSNQLATELVTPAENLSDLDPYIQEALAARGGDARQAQGCVIDESQWDFLVRARVINQLQRRDAALQSPRALEARRGAGAQTHSVARNARVSLVQNPVASGARLEVSVRSRLKPGGQSTGLRDHVERAVRRPHSGHVGDGAGARRSPDAGVRSPARAVIERPAGSPC